MTEITVKKIKAMGVRDDFNTVEVRFEDEGGADAIALFNTDDGIGLAERFLRYWIAKFKRKFKQPPIIEIQAAQTHILGRIIALEIAFGSEGEVYYGLPLREAKALMKTLSDDIAQLEARGAAASEDKLN